jgi:hypothetical protein
VYGESSLWVAARATTWDQLWSSRAEWILGLTGTNGPLGIWLRLAYLDTGPASLGWTLSVRGQLVPEPTVPTLMTPALLLLGVPALLRLRRKRL